jgi:hypothetical protein
MKWSFGKWLFRIVVYLFPRKRWRLTKSVPYWTYNPLYQKEPQGRPQGYVRIYEDQFGNVKKVKI